MPLGLLPGPVADGRDDHLGRGERLRAEGVQEFAEMALLVGAVDYDTQSWLHADPFPAGCTLLLPFYVPLRAIVALIR